MAWSQAERRRLLEADLPVDREVRCLLRDYLDRSGLALGDFAHRINYADNDRLLSGWAIRGGGVELGVCFVRRSWTSWQGIR